MSATPDNYDFYLTKLNSFHVDFSFDDVLIAIFGDTDPICVVDYCILDTRTMPREGKFVMPSATVGFVAGAFGQDDVIQC